MIRPFFKPKKVKISGDFVSPSNVPRGCLSTRPKESVPEPPDPPKAVPEPSIPPKVKAEVSEVWEIRWEGVELEIVTFPAKNRLKKVHEKIVTLKEVCFCCGQAGHMKFVCPLIDHVCAECGCLGGYGDHHVGWLFQEARWKPTTTVVVHIMNTVSLHHPISPQFFGMRIRVG